MDQENSELERLIDRTYIVECIVRFANAFDRKRWDVLRSCLAETVFTDYSQFRGEDPSTVSADEYVAARRDSLARLQTLHITTNHEVQIDGDAATCRSAYLIYRIDPNGRPGENRLDTAGNYEHGLVRTPDGWRIDRIRQSVVLQEGNREIHSGLGTNPATPKRSA